MTPDEIMVEYERVKTARDSLLLTVANLRGQLETIAAEEREACAEMFDDRNVWDEAVGKRIRARGQA
jgi:hypothetical protein